MFFVVSGYLITTIISRDQVQGVFSIMQFYERRVRRIVPALVLAVAYCFIAHWRLCDPINWRHLQDQSFTLSFSAQIFFFWHEQGYFEPQAQTLPLLHTWSIAVGEQFYAIFPIAMLLIRKVSPTRLCPVLGLLAAASFGLSLWSVGRHPGMAFYLAPSRAWELLLGSLLALGAVPRIQSETTRNSLSLLGLGLILISAIGYPGTRLRASV